MSSPAVKRPRLGAPWVALIKATQTHADYKKHYGKPVIKDPAEPKRVLGLDCEMVMAKPSESAADDEAKHSLARVSLVEYKPGSPDAFNVVVDVYVKPSGIITDLLTHVSGVSAEDMRAATLTQSDARTLVEKHVRKGDVIVGHSLWSDLQSLDWTGGPACVVDTSMLVAVKNAPKLTLALDDLSQVLLGVQLHYEGTAHDSVRDAETAIRVALHIAGLDGDVPVVLAEAPPRFQRRLTLHGFPADFNVASFPGLEDGVVRVAKVSLRTEGPSTASTSVDFESGELALAAFARLPVPPAHHADGYPDAQGFLRKKLYLAGTALGEAIAYCRQAPLSATFELDVPNNKIGQVMGKKGANIIAIQRMSGVHISNTRNAKDTRLSLRASSRAKIELAVSLVTRAVAGESFDVTAAVAATSAAVAGDDAAA